MGLTDKLFDGYNADEAMARANTKQLDSAKIDDFARQLKLSVKDAGAFRSVQSAIACDPALSANAVIAIAQKFLGGVRPKTKQAALIAIGQERLRVAHATAKGEAAAKTRVW